MKNRQSMLLVSIILLMVIGCSSWQRVRREDFPQLQKSKIRARLCTNQIVESNNYKATSDSLILYTPGTAFYGGDSTAYAYDVIESMMQLKTGNKQIIIGATVTTAVIAFMYILSQSWSDWGLK